MQSNYSDLSQDLSARSNMYEIKQALSVMKSIAGQRDGQNPNVQ